MAYSWKDGLLNGKTIPENSDDPLATLVASEGPTEAFSYSLSGSHSGLFTIDLYGRLSLRNELDYESSAVGRIRFPSDRQFSVLVRAHTDNGARQEERTFILSLQNENEFDADWRDGRYNRNRSNYNSSGKNLNENNNEGTKLDEFRATDADKVDVTYSLSGTDADYFSIDDRGGGVGRLYLKSSLDYEDASHGHLYSVVVNADSADASPTISQLYVLTVNNSNESNLDDTTATWRTRSRGVRRYENEDGGGLANFAARDSDGGAISYWLSGADEILFSLDSSNRLYVKESFDHESSENIARDHRYTVVVNALGLDGGTAIGDGMQALTQNFILTIRNRNEFETEWESGGNHTGANVSENLAPGVSLADFGAVDGDDIAVTYGLRGRHLQDSYFQIDKETGVLSTRREFNFESRDHYSVVVRARSENSNDGSARLEQTFIVTVGNVNENESTKWERNGRPTSRTIYENNEVGLSLADFGATDGDRTAVTYSIAGGDATYFSINAESGVLSLRSGLDYESGHAEYYSLFVHANSVDASAGLSSLYILRVRDGNVEINWATNGNPSSATVDELNAFVGVSLADFNVVNGISGDPVSYWLSNNNDGAFTIHSNGLLNIRQDRNYETDRDSHQYTVVVNAGRRGDSGNLSQLFILSVSNADEFKTDWRDGRGYNESGRAINENNSAGTRIASFRATDGDKVDVTYSLQAGGDSDYFSLDETGGVARLYAKSSFDHEEASHTDGLYNVVVVANSIDGSDAVSQIYVLTIRNRNEFTSSWQTDGNPTGNNISEGSGIGISLADFGATDGDGVAVTYGLRGRYRQDSHFEIDNETGILTSKQEFDFESRDHYTVQVRARSVDGSRSLSQDFILTVGNIDDVGIGWERGGTPSRRTIVENNQVGWSLADFNATDGDGAAISYSLLGDDAVFFSINSDRGTLSLTEGLDYESGHAEYYSVIVVADSTDASAAITRLYVLRVRDGDVDINWATNGNPSAVTLYETDAIKGLSLADFNIAIGGHIESGGANIEAKDGTRGNVSYWLSGRDSSAFAIDHESGILSLARDRNYESDRSSHQYTVVVNAGQRNKSGSLSELFILSVSNENEFDTDWRNGRGFNDSGRRINENNSEGARIAEFRATDADKVDITYSLAGNDSEYFSIEERNGGVGRLYLKSSLNYEDKALYSVVVLANSVDDSPAISQTYVLTLNNQNESGINDETATWHRRSSGTRRNENEDPRQLTQFEARDSDGPGISYWLSGDDNGLFSIDTVGKLYTKGSFDYDSTDNVAKDHRYTVVVNALGTAGDNVGAVGDGLLALTQTYILTIRNRDEFESSWESGGNPTGGNISENGGIGVSLADFGATDGDAVAVTYGLRGRHRDDSYFQIDKETGILTSRKEFNFESKEHYTVVVRARSIDGSDRLEQEFILTIGNVSDHTTGWQRNGTPTSSSIFENNEIGLSLADFGATDGDKVAVTYSLSGDDATYFSINAESGVLSLMSGLDYEDLNHTAEYYSVVVNANSVDASESLSSLYVLRVRDGVVDINWATNGNPSSATINEVVTATDSVSATGALNGVTVADFSIATGGHVEVGGTSITAAEGDSGNISYWLSGGDRSAFDINNTGILTLNGPRNYESDRSSHQYTVVVNAGQNGVDGSLSQLFILSVANVDEFGTAWRGGSREGRSLTENNREGQQLADFNATDGDGVTVTYNISGVDAAYFSIDGENGKLYVVSSLDHEDASHPATFYSVVVEARSVDADNPADTLTQLYILSVGNRNEFDSDWQMGGNPTGGNLSENNAIGVSLADFGATDGDGVTVTYSLRGRHRQDSYFEIDKETGILSSRKEFDFEDLEHYTVAVRARATDGSGRLEQEFILTIGNLDDTGVGWQRNGRPTRRSIYENNNIGLSLADFGATDGDGAMVTYSLEAGNHTHFFSINEESGVLSLIFSFDYENSHSDYYSVIINASSADSSPDVKSLYILRMRDAVVDIEWAADGNPSTATVSESDALIGLSVADFNIASGGHIEIGGANIVAEEGSRGNVSYWLSGSDSSSFLIDRHSGVLSLRRDRDYETDRDSHQYTVLVNAGQRNKSGNLTQLFILSVADDNDAPAWVSQTQPLDRRNYLPNGDVRTIELGEGVIGSSGNGVAGRQVGKFKAIDEDAFDNENDNDTSNDVYVTYGLSGTDEAYFSIDTNGRLYLASQLDFENTDHGTIYSVVVHAGSTVDGATNGISNLFVISITDRDDPTLWQTGSNPSGNAISENAGTFVAVADFGASDGDNHVDNSVTVTYSLRGNYRDDKYFAIHSDSGVLRAVSEFDFEDPSVVNHNHRYTVVVRARSDDGSPSINQTFVLTIGNADDNGINDVTATWQANPSGGVLAENNSVGLSLADFNAVDVDGPGINYSLSDSGDADYFVIDNATGILSAASVFNFEASRDGPYYTVVVNAIGISGGNMVGEGGLSIAQSFVLTVTDVNDAPVWQLQAQPLGGDYAPDEIRVINLVERLNGVDGGAVAGTEVARLGAVDDDPGANVTYNLTGADTGYFSLTSEGAIYLISDLDYEDGSHGTVYSVVVNAGSTLDGDTNGVSKLFVISLVDGNDAIEWQAGGDSNGTNLLENNIIGISVADFGAVDSDAGVTVTYSLLSGDDRKYFSINEATGVLSVRTIFDRESRDVIDHDYRYSVVVQARADDDGDPLNQTFVLTIFDADDNGPVWLAQAQPLDDSNYLPDGNERMIHIAESINGSNDGAVAGTQVAKFAAVDADETDSVTYSLTGDDAAYFSLDANGGLYLKSNLDYEDPNRNLPGGGNYDIDYNVVVHATSTNGGDGGSSISSLFELRVEKVTEEDLYWVQTSSGANLAENNSIGFNLGGIFIAAGVDGADGQNPTYSLAGDAAEYFDISFFPTFPFGSLGRISTKSVLDYESGYGQSVDNLYSVVLLAHSTQNGGAPNISRLFVVTVADVAGEPIGWQTDGNPSGAAISENNTVGALVADFNAVDDDGPVIIYSLSGTDAALFSINSDSGKLFALSSFDFEDQAVIDHDHRYSVVVNATPDDGSGISQIFILTIDNVNENPVVLTTADGSFAISISENNTIGATVADFNATDGDYGVMVTYSLSGEDADYFNLDSGTGVLTAKSMFDFEAEQFHSVVITATSLDGDSISETFSVAVQDVDNEQTMWQTGGNPSGATLVENTVVNTAVGVTVADFNATDVDGDSPRVITYSLQNGNDAVYFSINADTGALLTQSMFDYENQDVINHNHRYSVVVVADSVDESPAVSQLFILTISNFDDSATNWTANNIGGNNDVVLEIAENNTIGASVADFDATDGDYGVTVSYSLAGEHADYFNLDSGTGLLTAKSSFDFEDPDGGGPNNNFYQLFITASSSDGRVIRRGLNNPVVIEVTDVDDPTAWQAGGNPNGWAIYENHNIEDFVANFNATDADDGATVTYSLSGNDAAQFSINSENGELFALSSFDFEDQAVIDHDHRYSVVVVASSTDDSPAISQVFILSVRNVDEMNNVVTWGAGADGATISENNSVSFASTARITDFGHDAEAGVTVTYGLSGDDANYFSVAATTGWMFVTSQFDYESEYGQSIDNRYSVIVTANATYEGIEITRLFILTIDNVAEGIGWQAGGNPNGLAIYENNNIGNFVANFNATDPDGTSVTYSLQDGGDNQFFNLTSDGGRLFVNQPLDYESADANNYRYSVVVVATPTDDGDAISQTFILTLQNIIENTNDLDWASTGNPNGATIEENNAVGISLGDFDNNNRPGELIPTYALVGEDAHYFSIGVNSGWLSATSSFDYENQDVADRDYRYSVYVVAGTTDDTPAISRLFVLTVGNEFENNSASPQFTSAGQPTGNTIDENDAPGPVLADFDHVQGGLPSGVLGSYALTGDSTDYFQINTQNGRITLKSSLDYESDYGQSIDNRYSMVVVVNRTDDTTPISRLFIVTVNDINTTNGWSSAPNGKAIDENNNGNESLADFNNNGALPAGVATTYGLSGDNADYFSIGAPSGWFSVVSQFDYESDYGISINNRYSIIVHANTTGDEGTELTRLYILTINDTNTTFDWTVAPTGASIQENGNIGTSLADFDNDGPVKYSLSSGEGSSLFKIDVGGVLRTQHGLDYESEYGQSINNRYSLVVSAVSDGSESTPISRLFIVTVGDINHTGGWDDTGGDNPDGATIQENNAIGASVADFDNDFILYLHNYEVSGKDADYFSIHKTAGWLTLRSSLDYESDHGHLYSVVVVAKATTSEGSELTRLFVLTVSDVSNTGGWSDSGGDNPDGATIQENNSVGVSVADFDNFLGLGGALITYGLSGKDADYFNIDPIVGRLSLKSSLDFEDANHGQLYSVVITASANEEGTAISRTFILTVSDVSNTKGWNSGTPNGSAINENNSVSFNFADRITDFNNAGALPAGVAITYGLSGDNADYFNIGAPSGWFFVKSSFDYESDYGQSINNRYSVIITANATEDGTAISRVYILTIGDVNNTGNWRTDSGFNPNHAGLTENSGANYNVATFNTNNTADVTYGLSGRDADFFTIQNIGTDGRAALRTAQVFDYESTYGQSIENTYRVVVIANARNEGTAISRSFRLNINNIDYPLTWLQPTIFQIGSLNPNGKRINENRSSGELLGDFGTSSASGGGSITYGLSGSNANYFYIHNNGNLFTKSSFDYESTYGQSINNRYSVVVTANTTIEGDTALSRIYILTINNTSGGLEPDDPLPTPPVGLNGKILFDPTADTIGGINDGEGNEGLIIIGDDLSVTQYDSVSATNTVITITNAENFADSFVGYTDADGNTQNHWFFVRDDAGDHTGHIVFDADGLDVNLETLGQGGATTTADQINLLAGLNFGSDGDFAKPDDLDLDLNNNQAASLTHDQFLALIGGSNNIDFI